MVTKSSSTEGAARYRLDVELGALLESEITALIDAAEDHQAGVLVTDHRCTLVFKCEDERAEFRDLWGGTFR
jgi:hypothetical protein